MFTSFGKALFLDNFSFTNYSSTELFDCPITSYIFSKNKYMKLLKSFFFFIVKNIFYLLKFINIPVQIFLAIFFFPILFKDIHYEK